LISHGVPPLTRGGIQGLDGENKLFSSKMCQYALIRQDMYFVLCLGSVASHLQIQAEGFPTRKYGHFFWNFRNEAPATGALSLDPAGGLPSLRPSVSIL